MIKNELKKELYLFDFGLLLDKTDDEFSYYNNCYDKENGYYDITQYLFTKEQLKRNIEYAKSQVKLYKNSYCVITYQGNFLLTKEELKNLNDICFTDFAGYSTNNVIYSIMQDNIGNIIENFIKK